VIEWPSAKIVAINKQEHATKSTAKQFPGVPTKERIQQHLTIDKLQVWMNSQDSGLYRIKTYFISNVEPK
jgi:hypothetical protein